MLLLNSINLYFNTQIDEPKKHMSEVLRHCVQLYFNT